MASMRIFGKDASKAEPVAAAPLVAAGTASEAATGTPTSARKGRSTSSAAAEASAEPGHGGAGDDDDAEDYEDDGFEQDAVSHNQVKRESQQAVQAHLHDTRRARKGQVDTQPPRYLE
jgi:hypothetical protein